MRRETRAAPQTRQTRRTVVGLLAAGSGVGLLAACGAQPASQTPTDATTGGAAKVTLTAYFGVTGDQPQRFDSEVAQAYAKQRPNVEVQLLPQPSGGEAGMREKLQVLIAGGTPPDVWEYATIAETMVKYDWLVPLDDPVRRDKFDLNGYAKGLFDHVARYQGKTWLIPYGHGGNTMVMALNPQLFAAAGVALPGTSPQNTWTWTDWVEALRKLTREQGGEASQFGVADPGSWLASYPLLWQTDWVATDLKTIICDNPDLVECYTRYFELSNRLHVAPRPDELQQRFGVRTAIDAFNNGKAAATNMPPYAIPMFTQEKRFELALAPLPKGKVSVPDVNWHSFGIIKGSKQPDASWSFLRWSADQARWARFAGKIPAPANEQLPWLQEQFKVFSTPRLEAITNTLAAAIPQVRLFRLTAYPNVSAAIRDAFTARVLTGQAEPGTVLKELKPALQAMVGA
jgi:multiple sugar transport system substrate-binding protein